MSKSFFQFYHIFLKKYRQILKNIVLCRKLQGGDIISKLIHLFFIVYIINILITFYSIYTFFDLKLFHNSQGSKLQLKLRRQSK